MVVVVVALVVAAMLLLPPRRHRRPRRPLTRRREQDDYIFGALRAGASGFLLKRTRPEELIAAVHTVAAGEALLSPSVTRRVIDRMARQPNPDLTPGPARPAHGAGAGGARPRRPRPVQP